MLARTNETFSKLSLALDNDRVMFPFWWNLVPGYVVTVPWPRGWTEMDHLGNQMESSDPNDHYRPWLEANVGRQGWDWDWRLSDNCRDLMVRFRRGKRDSMVQFSMKWA